MSEFALPAAQAAHDAAQDHGRCFHCGEPADVAGRWTLEFDGAPRRFCCAGCKAVAATIAAAGLHDYYRRRDLAGGRATREAAERALADATAFGLPGVRDAYVAAAAGSEGAHLYLEGVTCPACLWLAEQALARAPGVASVAVDHATRVATVHWDPAQASLPDLVRTLAGVGLPAVPASSGAAQHSRRLAARRDAWDLGVALFSMMQAMMFTVPLYFADASDIETDARRLMDWAALAVSLPAVLYSARRFYSGLLRDLVNRHVSMDTPVAIAIVALFAGGVAALLRGSGPVWFDTLTMFIALLLLARWHERRLGDAALLEVERLNNAMPATALRIEPGQEPQTVPAAAIEPGDRLLVATGGCCVVDAHAESPGVWDESVISGESRAIEKSAGAWVPAGAINAGAPQVLRAARSAADSTLARIAQLTEAALSGRAQLPSALAGAARWSAPLTLLAAASAAVAWLFIDAGRSFEVAVAVLAVTCPCALGLALPASWAAARLACAKCGILIADRATLEGMADITDLIVDKTGTLTEARMQLTALTTEGIGRSDALAVALALEGGAAHPIAEAIARAAAAEGVTAATATELEFRPGFGVGGTVAGRRYRLGRHEYAAGSVTCAAGDEAAICLSRDGVIVARMAFHDPVRADAPATIRRLQEAGVRIHLASGDATAQVDAVARSLGIGNSDAHARLAPQDKLALAQRLAAAGRRIGVAGDGVNDAPILAASPVAIAMGSGADLSRLKAGAIIVRASLAPLASLRAISSRMQATIRQNLGWAIAYNAIALPLAMAGAVTPAWAALGMAASSVLVVANASRLGRVQ
ncbi:MAG TPA: heavy metal translocating P-type ATPase [Usitatibacteraceae bacterium]|nr:heavy metal translocating P-type ATPase [Usitatibacteraceae bacterium]